MRPAGFARWSLVAMAAALMGAAGGWLLVGGEIFTAGPLHAGDTTLTRMGGVASHAELRGRCEACHAPPWSRGAMSARCLECHTDIQAERRDTTELHGRIADAAACTSCHTEHWGPAGELTRLGYGVAHDAFFPLTGAHAAASCRSCHGDATRLADYADAPTECIGCHRDDDEHRGDYGEDCGACHGTDDWDRVAFDHRFPIDHGDEGPSPCRTCHEKPQDWKSYTCYGCHEHTPEGIRRRHEDEGPIRNLEDCMRCHPTGREHEGEGEGGGGDSEARGGRRGRDH